jgi:RNA recognition motif-containing protein
VFKNEAEGIKSGKINTDSNGRSTGIGVLVFSTRANAQKFVKDYNGVDLDGQPVKLEIE